VLAVTLPSLISLCAAFLFVALFSPESREWVRTLSPDSRREIFRSISPYLLLVILILLFNFLKPLKELFGPLTIAIKFDHTITSLGFSTPEEFGKALNIFLHPGTILALTGILSKLIFLRYGLIKKDNGRNILFSTITSAKKATIAIFSLVGAAVAMRHAGMIEILALGISNAIPRSLYPAASPFIGALGAFITGSNNNSNVLFAPLQLQTGLPADLLHQVALNHLGREEEPERQDATDQNTNQEKWLAISCLIYASYHA
jgi:lactate permease